MRTVVLVEGMSDRVALETLARRRGRSLAEDGVEVVAMGGATNVARHLTELGPPGNGVRVAGLCDAGEERWFRRGLERAGYGTVGSVAELESLGFYVCHADLEEELIRAVGVDGVTAVIAAEGELGSLRRLQSQPAHLGRGIDAQLHRFMGARAARKARYARLLVEALDLSRVPHALDGVLTRV
jgi:hypothetical protein